MDRRRSGSPGGYLPYHVQEALDAIGGAEPGSTVYSCPLPGCKWVHVEPPPGKAEDPRTLAGVFGPGVFAAVAVNERLQRTEEKLAGHVSTHPAAEWVPAMVKLHERIAELERALANSPGVSPS